MKEFGKGFAYCIGLFLAHADRQRKEMNQINDYGLWFNAAADHLYELVIPDNMREHEKEITLWQDKCIRLRLETATEKDFLEAIVFAKTILLKYDKACGIPAEEARWQ